MANGWQALLSKESVVGSPYTTETELSDDDEFLILVCDGVSHPSLCFRAALASDASLHLLSYATLPPIKKPSIWSETPARSKKQAANSSNTLYVSPPITSPSSSSSFPYLQDRSSSKQCSTPTASQISFRQFSCFQVCQVAFPAISMLSPKRCFGECRMECFLTVPPDHLVSREHASAESIALT